MTINIYTPEFAHQSGHIKASLQDLIKLRDAINAAIEIKMGTVSIEVFDSNGEEYSLRVESLPEEELNKLDAPYMDDIFITQTFWDGKFAVNPNICFGNPYLVRKGLRVDTVYDRHQAGESLEETAGDFDITVEEVQACVDFYDWFYTNHSFYYVPKNDKHL